MIKLRTEGKLKHCTVQFFLPGLPATENEGSTVFIVFELISLSREEFSVRKKSCLDIHNDDPVFPISLRCNVDR